MQSASLRWSNLFLFFSVLLGAVVRFTPTIMTGSPINDGGMFYVMIEDLKANHFMLPFFTSYNHLNIPFAYPPLSFYAGGLFSLLGISTFDVIRFLPPVISTLSILAFYWMASLMLDSRSKASLAALAYALMPRSFSWYIMGGGLSRSFGMLFLLLACASAWKLFTKPASRYVFLTALFGAGSILSHPETGLHAAATCVLIWFFKGRNLRGSRDALIVSSGVFAFTSPWWVTILAQHGDQPFVSALNTGGQGFVFWTPQMFLGLTEERFVPLFALLGLAGLAIAIMRRNWFLPAWLFLPFVVEARSAAAISILPLAILASVALTDFVIPKPALRDSKIQNGLSDWAILINQSRISKSLLACIMFLALISAFVYDFSLTNYIVSTESRQAMQWIRDNTASDSSFIILTGRADPFSDPTSEWFPAFARRMSQSTIQGREWLLGKDFWQFFASTSALRLCLNQDPSCVANWANAHHLAFDYVYIEKSNNPPVPLIGELRQDQNYALAFENDAAVIFARK
ncbi:MAG TPA: glycosyltransferase family 39 protein [Anaerolineales bacterium]|nr:glycosyltransferase family 39 protein [Anaerolineales bacterium]